MKKIIEKSLKLFEDTEVKTSSLENLKKIVNILNKDSAIIIKWIKSVWKLSLIKDFITKTKSENNFIFFDKASDIESKINSSLDLDKIFENQNGKIIILKECEKIANLENFVQKKISEKKKVILIWNSIFLDNISEIEIIPDNLDLETFSSIYDVKFIEKLSIKKSYLKLLTESIVSEILIKNSIKNVLLLNIIIHFFSKNLETISIREIHLKLLEKWIKVAPLTVNEYINFLLNEKFIKKVFRKDLKRDSILKEKSKYYFTDTWIRNAIYNFSLPKLTLIDNLLFQELSAKWYNILTWKNWTFYFSYLLEKDWRNLIIHISHETDKNELFKEARRLLKIEWNYEKFLLVADKSTFAIRSSTLKPVELVEIDEILEKL